MHKKPPPPSLADTPTLVPDSSVTPVAANTAAQTLTPLPSSSDSPTLVPESNPGFGVALSSGGNQATAAGVSPILDPWAVGGLQAGTVLGGRYEILQALGEGGMGTVYKATDRELDRLVALKVIRPDLARNPAVIQRFKQELILARQITHRNVVRIFDLGEADGIKFITMEFIAGQDLRSLLLQRSKLSPEEATDIIRQVCLALDAAHTEGVIHRDLKPQNIMRDANGRIVVMDFGLARLVEADGMTQTGAVIGTMEYMSPEQGLGQELDQRSDLFTIGLIFYELLTGQMPYKADTAVASLLKRTRERAAPVSDLDNKLPRSLSNVVAKCLEREPSARYGTAKELLRDLEAWQGAGASSIRLPEVRSWGRDVPWSWIGVALVVVVLAAAGYLLRHKLFESPGAQHGPVKPEVSLAVVPFRNASGDASLNWMGNAVSEMLRSDMGESAMLRTVASDRVSQILRDLRISPDALLDPDTLRRVADFTSADHLLWGQYVKLGDQIRLDATLQDVKQQRTVSLKAEAAGEKDLPRALQQLAQSVQTQLALPPETVKEVQAKSLKPSSQSAQAIGHYGQGLQLARQGKYLEAVKEFDESTKDDPKFALAYSKLAVTYSVLGYGDKAQEVSRKAVDLSDSVSPQEQYLIQAEHARVSKDYQKAIESYEKIAAILPNDSDIQYDLARLYEDSGSFEKAQADYAKILARDGNDLNALLHMGQVEIRRNNAQGSLDYLSRGLTLAIKVGNQEEEASILDTIGNAYSYLNKPEDALRNYQQALDIKRRLDNKGAIAESLNLIAQSQQTLGKSDQALKTFQEAIRVRREIGDKAGLGRSLLDLGGLNESLGRYDDALTASKEGLALLREVGDRQNEAMGLNNIGWMYLDKADYENAMTFLQQGLQLREKVGSPADVADSNYNIGETYARQGQYSQATDYYLKALDTWRKVDDNHGVAYASYGLGRIFQYQGRYGAALSSEETALKTWRATNESGFWLPQIQASYGNALALAGRWDAAEKNLDEALAAARELKNDPLIALVLNFQGERLFYRGDARSAKTFFQQAATAAARGKDREQTLVAKIGLSKVALEENPSPATIKSLQFFAQEGDRAGFKYLSLDASTYAAAGLIRAGNYARARPLLSANLGVAEKLGLQSLLARNEFLTGEALRLGGSQAEAAHHYANAHRILEEIRNEAKSEDVLKRNDLARIYADTARLQNPK